MESYRIRSKGRSGGYQTQVANQDEEKVATASLVVDVACAQLEPALRSLNSHRSTTPRSKGAVTCAQYRRAMGGGDRATLLQWWCFLASRLWSEKEKNAP
jgi:hypothetical protein